MLPLFVPYGTDMEAPYDGQRIATITPKRASGNAGLSDRMKIKVHEFSDIPTAEQLSAELALNWKE